jgi:hypothetical protein
MPRQGIGVMQANAVVVPGFTDAPFEKHQHGTAGIDDIGCERGIDCQKAGEKAPIPVSQ